MLLTVCFMVSLLTRPAAGLERSRPACFLSACHCDRRVHLISPLSHPPRLQFQHTHELVVHTWCNWAAPSTPCELWHAEDVAEGDLAASAGRIPTGDNVAFFSLLLQVWTSSWTLSEDQTLIRPTTCSSPWENSSPTVGRPV